MGRACGWCNLAASADPVNLSRQRDAVFRAVYEHTRVSINLPVGSEINP